jgi:enoyl-CoA hydratase
MSEFVSYAREGRIATITMDDGKVNVFSFAMLHELHAAFDQAASDEAIVVLTGRPDYFSAGFDLKVFANTPERGTELVALGARLTERILSFPTPVVVACSGHAYPAGAFLLLSSDARLGVEGPYRIGLNEVRIGLTVPWFAIELARHRLHPAAFDRTVVNATMYDPGAARQAGFLDRVVAPDDLLPAALATAADLAELDPAAHTATKLRARARVLTAVRQAIESELSEAESGATA